MIVAILAAVAGVVLITRMSGKSPITILITLVLLGITAYVFSKIEQGVNGGLKKNLG